MGEILFIWRWDYIEEYGMGQMISSIGITLE